MAGRRTSKCLNPDVRSGPTPYNPREFGVVRMERGGPLVDWVTGRVMRRERCTPCRAMRIAVRSLGFSSEWNGKPLADFEWPDLGLKGGTLEARLRIVCRAAKLSGGSSKRVRKQLWWLCHETKELRWEKRWWEVRSTLTTDIPKSKNDKIQWWTGYDVWQNARNLRQVRFLTWVTEYQNSTFWEGTD